MENFNNEKPIYLQIYEKIKFDILTGNLKQGDKIPPVRELALQMRVNPNTMQKALTELDKSGFVKSNSTSGRFVVLDKDIVEDERRKQAEKLTTSYIENMERIGFNLPEICELLEKKK